MGAGCGVKCQYGLRSSRDLHAGVLVVVQRFRSDLGLFARLCALVPSPRMHLSRAYGVLANRHRLHRIVAPPPPAPEGRSDKQLGLFVTVGATEVLATTGRRLAEQLHEPNPPRVAWDRSMEGILGSGHLLGRRTAR